MAKIGYINKKISDSALLIHKGRQIIMKPGYEAKGREMLSKGLDNAVEAIKDAKVSKSIKTIMQAEQTFVKAEYLLYKGDKHVASNLEKAILSFEDAKSSYNALISGKYKIADLTYGNKDRKNSVPVDAFHKTCNSHKTRLQNSLRSTSVNREEKLLISERISAVETALKLYIEKQKEALGLPANAKIKGNERER